jgi:hypothetical protein
MNFIEFQISRGFEASDPSFFRNKSAMTGASVCSGSNTTRSSGSSKYRRVARKSTVDERLVDRLLSHLLLNRTHTEPFAFQPLWFQQTLPKSQCTNQKDTGSNSKGFNHNE